MNEQQSSSQRHATRAPVDRPVRLQFDDTLEVVEAACRNISIGGMFIRSTHCRPAGSLVRFELDVDDGSAIRGLAEVVWMRSREGGPGHEAGMGVKFRFLEQRDRQQIFKLVSQHIKDRLATRQPFADSGLSAPAPTGAEPPPTVRPPQRPGLPVSPAAEELAPVSAPASPATSEGSDSTP
ncbi:MAG: PilZ domain-containing protein, partial [Holophagales bacterium]|nr:PilZ domain-containing protein [Holophagales bacterium]